MQAEIILPLIMGCALMWWVGRTLSWQQRLMAIALTLAVIVGLLFFERGAGVR